ncbi:MAG: flagellar basal body protein FliL [Treponema sp. GWB1_62_6]|nr:MAG: flagellar basal body protein FliL [Treponema sp. GWC1_61_84]OHE65154.1 MAG: flagellar basal body protein FliL [Treponema sp. GWA1_62_8]OHE70483.1 MAG: flagellar basal body protein FliL [Treponema sp. RIFOXYC1_FULL_61_9]OHE72064.1 MAG: flagellar basal body protein FliL [Treponema sp. GWB1_62_6]HCM27954.1 flagellar basal body protein FliL [Treponema sp.]
MSDNRDELDLEGSEPAGGDASPKKASGLTTLLPSLLKFAAIGLGALIFIVTVSVITFRILNGTGKAQTVNVAVDEYTPKKPQLSWFTTIGVIRTRTKDPTPFSVVVNVILGYDLDSKVSQNELTNRLYELKDFIRNFFSLKTAAELQSNNEAQLKIEMREILNTQVLQDTKVREILFQQLDVVEM